MGLQDLDFKPGIYADETERGAGRLPFWKDCDHVRFHRGLPEKIGGWVKDNPDEQMLGTVRAAFDWQSLGSAKLVSFGSSQRLYIWEGGLLHDITPVFATGSLTNPFATTTGSAIVTVTDTSHGLTENTGVIFTGASAVGGITVNGEYTVTTVVDDNTYTITHSTPAGSDASGGGAVGFTYLLPAGNDLVVPLFGWGAGGWGNETWGTARTLASLLRTAAMWSLDTWGEDLIACRRDQGVYVWDTSAGTATRAAQISGAPTQALAAFVSQEDRHLVVLGADADPLLIRWSDQEDYTVFTPTTTNTAGDKRLDQGTEIFTYIKLRAEHLIFTDEALYSMTFVGPTDTFGFRPLGSNHGLAGPKAVVEYEGKAYWMGDNGFYVYSGVVEVIDCPVHHHVFDNISDQQRFIAAAGVNQEFSEIWWLYSTASDEDISRYVVYNTVEKTWYYGTLERGLYVGDSDIIETPYAVGTDGYLYYHEVGTNADGAPLESYLESGAVELNLKDAPAGTSLMHVSKLIPDFYMLDGRVSVTVVGRKYPQAAETQSSGPIDVTAATEFINPRLRARQVFIRVESEDLNTDWRMGTNRLDIRPHGGR